MLKGDGTMASQKVKTLIAILSVTCVMLQVTYAVLKLQEIELPRKVSYPIAMTKAVYKHPYLNVTFKVFQDINKTVTRIQVMREKSSILIYDQKLNLKLYKGDKITLVIILEAKIDKPEFFTFTFWYEQNEYQTFKLLISKAKQEAQPMRERVWLNTTL